MYVKKIIKIEKINLMRNYSQISINVWKFPNKKIDGNALILRCDFRNKPH
jgi:hypothetical protein